MLRAIKDWKQRRSYRKTIEANLWHLLVALPEAKIRQIIHSYPGIITAADNAFADGENADEQSVQIAAIVVADLLRRGLSPATRQTILAGLRARAEGVVGATGDDTADLWINVVLTLENQAFTMVESRKIASQWRDMLMSEVVGALRGYDAAERSRDRVIDALESALFTGSDQRTHRSAD